MRFARLYRKTAGGCKFAPRVQDEATLSRDEDEFIEAVKRGDASFVADLLGRRPELVGFAGDYSKTGLHWAAETDQLEVARALLAAGADIEAKTSWGATPLDWAATMGGARVADLLLSRGATGFTLITAAALGILEAVEALTSVGDLSAHRRRGAPDSPDDYWPADSAHMQGDVLSDAMYAAARNGHAQVVEYLLDHGATTDAKGVFAATGLHWAAINGHRPAVDLLVARGASLALRDARFGGTPADWAREGGHQEIAEVLDARAGID
jgi:ankyrin repeat protein